MGRRRRKSDREGDRRPAPKPVTAAVQGKVEAWAEEAADEHGLVVFDVEIHQPWVIQIYVDHEGAEPGQGVTIDECAKVSRYVEAFLDVDDDVWPHYTLEVSSPGIERKLKKKQHFVLSVGRDVRIVVHEPIAKRNVFEGTLVDFDGETARVECADDDVVAIQWGNIAKARLIYDFSE